MMQRECEQCGGPIPDEKRVSAMFCSRKCANAHFNGLEKAARVEAKHGRPPCIECGAAISPERPASTRFCSSACQQRHRKRQLAVPRSCEWCGVTLHTHDPQQRFCGKRCSAKATHAALGQRQRWARIAEAWRQNLGASDRVIGRMLGISHKTVARALSAD